MTTSPVDPEARSALARRIRDGMQGRFAPGSAPSTEDRGVVVVHRRLFGDLDSPGGVASPWSPAARRDAERALLFLETDLPGPGPAWFERIPGAFPLGWVLFGGALALGASLVGAPSALVYLGVAVFAFGGVTAAGGSLWVLALMWADRGRDPSLESPDECWPFSSRRAYEAARDAS